MFKALRKTVVYSVTGLSCLYCTSRFVCAFGKCEDVSMEPAIQHGDIVLITPFHVSHNLLTKGDIVFCYSPKNARSVICKRIIGMEGDSVSNTESGGNNLVSQGQVWLEGDNRDASIDSRDFGAVPYGLILSKVSFRVIDWFGYLYSGNSVLHQASPGPLRSIISSTYRKAVQLFEFEGPRDVFWPLRRIGFLPLRGEQQS